eukprot:TRINITY_DN12488_c0_g1_i1.p1 TRINITY_DN12488_c0_g1~~TRINITY_DN12488_c0_g1_i1.p1  ORF type:complete len:462 (-),score=114.14 TRINITY_DN12488_c0_g1_i1:63-1448(-)
MDIFECSLCLQLLKDPRVISCGHTFCKTCLQQLRPSHLRCPLCQCTFPSVDTLPSNFVVLKWMESEKESIKKLEVNCENCEGSKVAEIWCDNCSSHYCTACHSAVHQIKTLRNHHFMSIKEKKKKATFTKCKSHQEENKVYCLDCKEFICGICVIDDHPHKVMSIVKYSEILRNELKNLLSVLKEGTVHYNQMNVGLEREITELTVEFERIQNLLKEKNLEKMKINQQKEKTETSHIVLIKAIEEMGITELMNKHLFDLMKDRTQKIFDEVLPVEIQQRLENERLEKERQEKLEKERQEKLEKERQEKLEKERQEKLEKERREKLEKEMFEKGQYTKKILPAEWWDNTGPLGGIRKGTQKSKEIYFIVSKSDVWDKGAFYVPPDGYKWISTEEYPIDGDRVYSYHNQGGWNGYRWNGKEKFHFILSDSHKTNNTKHAGQQDDRPLYDHEDISYFAGIVCTK